MLSPWLSATCILASTFIRESPLLEISSCVLLRCSVLSKRVLLFSSTQQMGCNPRGSGLGHGVAADERLESLCDCLAGKELLTGDLSSNPGTCCPGVH